MADTEATSDVETKVDAATDAAGQAAEAVVDSTKARFAKAIDDAKASAVALGKKAQEQTEAYREKLNTADLVAEAKALGQDAKERAATLANDGKAKASDALTSLGKVVADNASLVDEKLGEKYGDYARTAARSLQEVAAKLESKDLGELGEDAKDFVKNNTGVALGIAAGIAGVAGFIIARSLKGDDTDA